MGETQVSAAAYSSVIRSKASRAAPYPRDLRRQLRNSL